MEKVKFNTRAYNNIELLPFGLIKKSSESDRLLDEVFYYDSIPKNVLHLFPRKIDSYIEDTKYNLILEYYPYKNLGEYMISDDPLDWISVFSNLKGALECMSQYSRKVEDISKFSTSMYIQKTFNEYHNLKNSYHDTEMFSSKTLVIDGLEYDNFETIWNDIESIIKNKLLNYNHTMIHGDMCFSNILYHPKVGSRFIDMRGSFGERGIYGDRLYDYAKLLHSVEGGYEFFINDKFNVSKLSKRIYNTHIDVNKNKQDALDAYIQIFSNMDINLVRLVEGLIFIGMCARHYDSKERQMIMYLTGIKNLNEALKTL